MAIDETLFEAIAAEVRDAVAAAPDGLSSKELPDQVPTAPDEKTLVMVMRSLVKDGEVSSEGGRWRSKTLRRHQQREDGEQAAPQNNLHAVLRALADGDLKMAALFSAMNGTPLRTVEKTALAGVKHGYLQRVSHGIYGITDAGREVLRRLDAGDDSVAPMRLGHIGRPRPRTALISAAAALRDLNPETRWPAKPDQQLPDTNDNEPAEQLPIPKGYHKVPTDTASLRIERARGGCIEISGPVEWVFENADAVRALA